MRSILDSARDGVLIELDGQVVYANDAYADLLGYRRATDLVGWPVEKLVAEADAERLTRYGSRRITGQQTPDVYDFSALRRDCTSVRLQASVSMTHFGGRPYITTIVRPFPTAAGPETEGHVAGPHDTLSARERQVMDKLISGLRPKVIACELEVSEKTVATHRTRLLQKLGVTDNRELFRYALRHRLVDWS